MGRLQAGVHRGCCVRVCCLEGRCCQVIMQAAAAAAVAQRGQLLAACEVSTVL